MPSALKSGPSLGPKKAPNLLLVIIAGLILCGYLQSCRSLASGEQPVIIEHSYSPAPTWLSQQHPVKAADGSLQLVYRSPSVPDLDLAANQLKSKIAMQAKEQLTAFLESAFVAAQPQPVSFGALDRSAFSEAVAKEVTKGVDGGVILIKDYYYRKLRTGNRPAVAELFALVAIPRPAYNGLVAAIAATLRQSPSSTLRSLAKAQPKAGSF